MTIQEAKHHVRSFLQDHYTDKKLAQGLDHLRAGDFRFVSCCCFVGIATAKHQKHQLRGYCDQATWNNAHYKKAKELPGGEMAEQAAVVLSRPHRNPYAIDDARLTRRLIPMFLAEIRRREKARHGAVEAAAIVESTPSPVL
jgi:hypothetical protein